MKIKKCFKCGTEKEIGFFYKHKQMADGHLNKCKECTKIDTKQTGWKKYYQTEKGVIRTIYKSQVLHSKRRGHKPPVYTKKELGEWMYRVGFKNLFREWVKSGYIKSKKPSVDRVNDFNPYTFDNIVLTTWELNAKHQQSDMISGVGVSGEKCKSVAQCSLGGNVLAIYHSQSEASRQTGISNKNISSCCRGKRYSAGGYLWIHTE